MIKIFLESDKFSHKAGVTKHATNSLARKSHAYDTSMDFLNKYGSRYVCHEN